MYKSVCLTSQLLVLYLGNLSALVWEQHRLLPGVTVLAKPVPRFNVIPNTQRSLPLSRAHTLARVPVADLMCGRSLGRV